MASAAGSACVRFACGVLLLCAEPASAGTDETHTSTLATVDVTARERIPNPDAAGSVEVIDAEALALANLHEIEQLQDAVANLRIGSLGGRASQTLVSLRGYTNPYGAAEAATVLYVDGVPVNDFYSFNQRLFDVARIEVAKGPQGTRGGSSAEAGAINIVTRRPDATTQAFVDVGALSRNGFDLAAGASGALGTHAYASLAAARDGSDGYIDNQLGNRPYDRQDGGNVRARVVWQPSDRWEFAAALLGHRIDDRGGEIYLPVERSSFDALPTLDGRRLGRFEQAIDHEGFSRARSTLSSATAAWNGTDIVWHALASWRVNDARNSTDYDLSPQPWFYMDSSYRVHQAHAEVSVQSAENISASHSWIAGVAGDHRDLDFLRIFHAGPGNVLGFPVGDYVRTDALLRDGTYAIFGESAWRLGAEQRWGFTAGVRVERAGRDVDFRPNGIDPRAARLQRADTQALPKLVLDYRLAPAHSAYVSVARGWKAGGYNADAFSAASTVYEPEHTIAWEAGVKGASDAALGYALAAYRNDIRDYQDLVISEDNLASYIVNARRVRTQGVEARIAWRPSSQWSLGVTAGTVHATYIDDPLDASGFRLDGRRLQNVPRRNGNVHAGYDDGTWLAHAEIAAAGGFEVHGYNAANQTFHAQYVPGYAVLNAKIGYRGAHWSSYAYATNLTDRRYFTAAGFGFAQLALYAGAVGSVAPPRTVGVEFKWTL